MRSKNDGGRRRAVPPVRLALFIVIGAGLLAGCGGGDSVTPTPTPTVTLLDVDAAYALVQGRSGDPEFVLLDVRTSSEFALERIDGAVNIDVLEADFDAQVGMLDRLHTVLVYCLAGSRSATAADRMLALGFVDLFDLDGGIEAWKAAGNPTMAP